MASSLGRHVFRLASEPCDWTALHACLWFFPAEAITLVGLLASGSTHRCSVARKTVLPLPLLNSEERAPAGTLPNGTSAVD